MSLFAPPSLALSAEGSRGADGHHRRSDSGTGHVAGGMGEEHLFEAQIDDQVLARAAYDELLARHGFTDGGWFQLAPVHAVTYGRR